MGTLGKAIYNVGFWIRETGQALDRLGCRLQGNYYFGEQLSRHRPLMNVFDKVPCVDKTPLLLLAHLLLVMFRSGETPPFGDVNRISVGGGTNIQDNSLVHVAKPNLSAKVLPTVIGDNVTIGLDLGNTMLRGLSTRRNHGGYEKLGDESSNTALLEGKLKRVTSVPTSLHGHSRNLKQELPSAETATQEKINPNKENGKTVHPLLGLFGVRFQKKNKKATAKPEFARYIEYMKEGGIWDSSSNTPVIYYK